MNTETIERPVSQIIAIAPTKTTALAAVEMQAVAIARFGDWRIGAAELVKRFAAVVFDCTTTKGMKEAEDARAEVRAPRYLAQNVAKNSKTELAAISRAVGAEEKAIIDALAETEAHIEGQISAELARKAAIKAEAARVELARKEAHENGIARIRGSAAGAIGKTSAQILRGIAHLEDADMTGWEEFIAAARAAQAEAITTLRTMAAAALAAENAVIEMVRVRAEQVRIAAEQRAEGERLAAEAAQQKRIAAEAKQVADAAAKVEDDKRAAFAKLQADAAKVEADKLASERAEFARLQAETAKAAAAEREAGLAELRAATELQKAEAKRQAAFDRAEMVRLQAESAALIAQQQAEILRCAAELDSKRVYVFEAGAQVSGPVEFMPIPDDAPDITTNEIRYRLDLGITVPMLVRLGFAPTSTSDHLPATWRERDFRPICAALIAHIRDVAA